MPGPKLDKVSSSTTIPDIGKRVPTAVRDLFAPIDSSQPEQARSDGQQFGDFGNGAQIMINQFIATAESKWGQPTGLVMLLPHGYEGQGPEHSSARIERFLTLCAQDNMQVVNCTTPAQYFHLPRRQMTAGKRKPLVIFTPKSLLRYGKAVSTFEELSSGGFREVIDDTGVEKSSRAAGLPRRGWSSSTRSRGIKWKPRREGTRRRRSRGCRRSRATWALGDLCRTACSRFDATLDADGRKLRYIGRAESSSPATGSKKRHDREQAELIMQALA